MEVWIEIIVCAFASLGAGLGTGFAGMSAAAVISPMLITFLGVPAYQAIGIALASDVIASAVSAYVYGKNKKLDIKNGLLLLASVLFFTSIGSVVSSHVGNTGLGLFSVFMTFVVGIQFLLNPYPGKLRFQNLQGAKRLLLTLASGAVIGFICGFVGAGGGMMMLIVLTVVLGYELKTAVGTSVFVMAFTALTGAAEHFIIGGVYDWYLLGLCVILTCFFAQIASHFANRSSEVVQKRMTGGVLTALGIAMMLFTYL